MTDWLTLASRHLERTGGTVQLDSRAVRPGDVFVALPGQRVDGRDFILQVLGQQDVLVLAEAPGKQPQTHAGIIWVDGLQRRLGQLAEALFAVQTLPMQLLGVTGTNGKTSVSHYLAQVLSRDAPCGVIGTLGYGLWPNLQPGPNTTPDVISNHRLIASWGQVQVPYAVMEVSSHAMALGRVDGLRYRLALFTHLTRDHLDFHPDMESYFDAKARLFDRSRSRDAVICGDDAWGEKLLEMRPDALRVSGRIGGRGDVVPVRIDRTPEGLGVQWRTSLGWLETRSELIGTFNVANLALVIGAMYRLEFPAETIVQRVNALLPVAGRMEPVRLNNGALAIIDFAHTPDALEKALQAARHHTRGELFCVFGCGGDRDRGKRPLMAAVASERADRIWVTSDNNRFEAFARIVGDMRPGLSAGTPCRIVEGRMLAVAEAVAESRPGDVVLVAGKGHEGYQEVRGERVSYSDMAALKATGEVAS